MLIALLSDLHWARGPHWAEIERVHGWIADDLEARVATGDGPALIVLAGDIFDAGSWPTERNAAAAWMQRLATLAPVLVVRGNHDRFGDLDLFAKLRARCPISVYDQPAIHRFQGGSVAVLPWLDRVGSGRTAGRYSAEEEARQETRALLDLLDKLGRDLAASPAGARLFAGHLMLRGARTSHGQPRKQSKEFEIGLQDLGRIRADAYLLGHVHLGQTFFLGRAPVIYNGSVRRTAFGELEQKRYTLVRLGPKGVSVGHVITPTTPMLLVEGQWEHGTFSVDTDKLLAEARGAQVRLTYQVAAEDQAEARHGSELLRASLAQIGATLKPVPCVIAPPRQRAAEIVLAKTIADKFDVWCEKNGKVGAHVALARSLLVELERTSDVMVSGCRGGGARLHRTRLESMAGYPHPVELDVDALPGRIAAVFGPNGVGKSLLLGCWPGAMYGEIPADTRLDDTPLSHYARGADALVEAVVDVGGEPWTLRRKIGRGKAFAIDPSGKEKDRDGGLKTFERWARDNLLPRAVFLNSIFAPQGSEGLVKLRPGVRREVLLEALGLEGIKALAEQARRKAVAIEQQIDELRGNIANDLDELNRAGPADRVQTAREARARAEQEVADRRGALAAARSADAVNEAARAHRRTLEASAAETRALCTEFAQELASPLLPQAEAIRSAHGAVLAHRTALLEAKETRGRLAAEAALLEAEAASAQAMADQATARATAATADQRAMDEVLRDAPLIEAAVAALAGLEEADVAANEAVEALMQERHRLEQARARAHGQRLAALRAALEAVARAATSTDARALAQAALRADVDAEEGDLDRLDQVLRDRRQVAEETARAVVSCRALAQRSSELGRARDRMVMLEVTATREETAAAEQAARARGAREQAARARGAMPPLPAPPADAALAEQLGELVEAERRAPRATSSLALARARIGELEHALALLPAIEEVDHAPLEQAVADAEHTEEVALRHLVVLEEAHGRAAETRARADRNADLLADARLHHRAWGLLAEALGPKGIPLYEIDALGPELTAIANDLLHSCYGPRFTIVVDTQRPGTKNDTVNEVMIWVHDTEATGADAVRRDARAFNAGARFFSGLAFSLALAVIVCARAGAACPTIIRDEHAAGLSVDNRAPAMQMMRRACDIIGAEHMLIVTHDREFLELADCAVLLEQGGIEIRQQVTF
jgi:energy-coupling factor transporter ATP-binding protein EcfA2/predicted phosphodiesterase